MAAMEKDPSCNPVDPLLAKNQEYKPYPVQPEIPPELAAKLKAALNNAPQNQEPTAEDFKNFDIVKATQYGALERVTELIEDGYDVNQPDHENVTLLHWAAINNRHEIVKYYIKKGAIVDKLGGDLNSTSLHWATRQGHLSMVVLLMSYGADPAIRDGEGCSCIHLASQFGHSSIVAYLLAKGQDVDLKDKNGMTALMWASYRVFAPDPTRLLLTFNASVDQVDKFHKNTALHWACTIGNHIAVKFLLDAGANLNAQNDKGETPLQVAKSKKGSWIVQKLVAARKERGLDTTGILDKYSHNKDFRKRFMLIFPFYGLFAVGAICHLETHFLYKLLYLALFVLSWRLSAKYFFDSRLTTVAPVALYLATKFWMYVTWFSFYLPYVSTPEIQIPFFINTVFLMFYFYKSWRTDPGVIKSTREEKIYAILQLAETQNLDLNQFCNTCIVRRPVRSKHCSICNRCIALFDHHCPWVDNCVGINNHKYFVGYLVFLLGMILWCFFGAVIYWRNVCEILDDDGFFTVLGKVMSCSPWVFWIAVNSVGHMLWVGTLLACQLYQVSCLAATTNERMNFVRYKHFHTDKPGVYKSPFNRGMIKNLVDLCQWRCFGLCRPLQIDWMKEYDMEEVASVYKSGSMYSSSSYQV